MYRSSRVCRRAAIRRRDARDPHFAMFRSIARSTRERARGSSHTDDYARVDLDACAGKRARDASRARGQSPRADDEDASTNDASALEDARARARTSIRATSHFGRDPSTSTVSYDAGQRLLTCGTRGGVKTFGGDGFEATCATTSGRSMGECVRASYVQGATRFYRCGDDGSMTVWDAREARELASGTLRSSDGVAPSCASEAIRGTNFYLTGMSDGSMLVHAVGVDGSGRTTVAQRRGYKVSASSARGIDADDSASAPVVAVRMRPGRDECARVLIAWSDRSMALWHLHEKRSTARTAAADDSDDSALTCAEWLDENFIITGHSDGVVRVWRIRSDEIVVTQRIRPHSTVDAAYKGALMPIRALRTFVGDEDDVNRDVGTWVLCVGGEGEACPDPVICLRATRAGGDFRIENVGAVALPWFGPVLDAAPIPFRGVIESVCVLSEGSQLHLHDVRYGVANGDLARPREVNVCRPALSTACGPAVCVAARDIEQAFMANALRGGLLVENNDIDASYGWTGSKWPINGGQNGDVANAPRGRIVVGAYGRDGSGVCVYLDRGGRLVSGGRISISDDPASRLYLDAGGALLVIGRKSGSVEIYALREFPSSDNDARVRERTYVRDLGRSEMESEADEREFLAESARDFADIDSTAACVTSVYTLIGVYKSPTHAGKSISCVRTNASATLLAIGDSAGGVSLLNIQRGSVVWTEPSVEEDARAAPTVVVDFDFGLPLPDVPEENVLVVLDAASSVRFHALSNGSRIGKTMHPKNPSEALAISLLQIDGTPSDVVPPGAVRPGAKIWFAPPRNFTYSFLAAEFSVDDDDEDIVPSTDEEADGAQPIVTPSMTMIVVTVAKDAMRAYHAVGCSRGERSALRKVRLDDEPLNDAFVVRDDDDQDEFAHAFGHGRTKCPFVVALTTTGRILAFNLPSLRLQESAFGPSSLVSNASAFGGSRGGSMVVVGDDGLSLTRFETFSGPFPARGTMIDIDVERAAEAARAARRAMEENDPELAVGTSPKRDALPVTPTQKSKTLTMSEALRQRAKKAMEKFEHFTTSPLVERPTPRETVHTTTDLALLFAETRIEEPSTSVPASASGKRDVAERKARDELFSTSVTPTRATSAAAVREKYGRNTASAAASAAADARDAAAERGEKLASIQDKSAALEADAANFADLAREIRKRSERRWL